MLSMKTGSIQSTSTFTTRGQYASFGSQRITAYSIPPASGAGWVLLQRACRSSDYRLLWFSYCMDGNVVVRRQNFHRSRCSTWEIYIYGSPHLLQFISFVKGRQRSSAVASSTRTASRVLSHRTLHVFEPGFSSRKVSRIASSKLMLRVGLYGRLSMRVRRHGLQRILRDHRCDAWQSTELTTYAKTSARSTSRKPAVLGLFSRCGVT
jgi:hypothetical protein